MRAGWSVAVGTALVLVACRAAQAPAPPATSLPPQTPPKPVVEQLDASAPADAAPLIEEAFHFEPRDVNHVLIGGQSLAVGVSGAPPLTLTQPFHNLMFNTGVMAGNENLDTFLPLIEGDFIPGSKATVETMGSGFANLAAELAQQNGLLSHDLLVSIHGSGAKRYTQLKKGTRAWGVGMAQIEAGRDVSARLHKSYVVRAVLVVHGESDHAEKSTRYANDLTEWQADYEHDIQAITKQTESIPLFQTQISSWTKMMGGTETSAIPQAQLAASVASRGKIVLVGPKYHLAYVKDGVHLTPQGYRHMGEDYAKAYRRVVLEGKPWEPLRPISITRVDAEITVRFAVPVPPIAIDTENVSAVPNYGFEYEGGDGAPTITKVAITGPDTVTITLSAVPTSAGTLAYAFTGARGAPSGPRTGARGNLRDSDPTKSRSKGHLYNWCVHFQEPIKSM